MDREIVVGAWYIRIARRYRESWLERHFRFSLPISLAMFIVSMVVNSLAIDFATDHASSSVTDIILSNIPIVHVDYLFVYGTFVVIALTALFVLPYPNRIPFALYATTLFFFIRSAFVTMTHIAPFAAYISPDFGQTINNMFFGADLFFSGHTGLPFLGVLVFWHKPAIRNFYFFVTIFFATIVLLGHLHYTIDVFSAFFITYGIFHIAQWLFPAAWARFETTL
ncbi:MAG: hypothetical protein KGI70_02105 [Patescibacteria group bacterium]|nr:hypothetical protein [Patescibacteria group bacterium]